MNISLLQVLNAPLFENVKILSGRAGLGRIVKRASVFDAPFKEDVLEKDILAPGDFFITSLLQFQPKSEELMQVLALLVWISWGDLNGGSYMAEGDASEGLLSRLGLRRGLASKVPEFC